VTLNISEQHLISPYPHFVVLFQDRCHQYVYYCIFRSIYMVHTSLISSGRSNT